MNTFITRILASVFIASAAVVASAEEKSVTLTVDGKPVLALTAPAAAKVTASNGYVNVRTTNVSLHVWAVRGAKSVNDALPRVAGLIKSEFINFKTTSSTDMLIAGTPAKYVTGSGNEADDGDPGNAGVVFFVAGGRVFAGCVHGEFDDASRARAPMLALLMTARVPP